MNKTEFNKFLSETIGNLPIEKQEKELDKLTKYKEDYLAKLKKNHTCCTKCHKYSKTKEFTQVNEVRRNIETTFTDAGYGDDDRYGEVEYIYQYLICPICKFKNYKNRIYVRTLWEKTRR